MVFGHQQEAELDDTDRRILDMLQDDCRTALARIGEQVGLSAPSVIERIKKLESAGIIRGYHAVLDARLLGLDVTAFIGVIASHPDKIGTLERQLVALDGVLECHHVTGEYTLAAQGEDGEHVVAGGADQADPLDRRRDPDGDHGRALDPRGEPPGGAP